MDKVKNKLSDDEIRNLSNVFTPDEMKLYGINPDELLSDTSASNKSNKSDVNDYGVKRAQERAKLKQKRKQELRGTGVKPTMAALTAKADKVPTADWSPMDDDKIVPYSYIDWNDESTNYHANNFLDYIIHGKLSFLTMPTGVGKTAIVVAAIGKYQKLMGKPIPFIVTAPKAAIDARGWKNTIASYNLAHPDNKLHLLATMTTERFALIGNNSKSRIDSFKRLGKDGLIVLDEAHKYKTPTTNRTKGVQKYSQYKKIAISATPLTNDVIMDTCSYLIIAGIYNSKHQFEVINNLEYCKDRYGRLNCYYDNGRVNKEMFKGYDLLVAEWRKILYKPTIDITSLDMPDIVAHIIQLDIDEDTRADCMSLLRAYTNRMFDSFKDYYMEYVMRLHQSTIRLNKLTELVLDTNNVQPLIFYENKSVRDSIIAKLEELGINDYQQLDGEGHLFSDINHDNHAPILIQYMAGAEAVEFKQSNCSIYYQNQGSYLTLDQTRGRNRRRGMSGVINHYYMISDEPIDIQVFDRVSMREEISKELLEEIVQGIAKDWNLTPNNKKSTK